MIRGLLLLLAFTACCVHLSVKDRYFQYQDSVFKLELDGGHCTAFIGAEGKWVTAGHCAHLGQTVSIQGPHGLISGVVTQDDDSRDVAIITAPTPGPPVVFDTGSPARGEEVISLGFPFYSRLTGLTFSLGYVLGDTGERLLVGEVALRGYSGGPVVSSTGQVIGLVSAVAPNIDYYDLNRHSHKDVGLIVPSRLIVDMLAR